MLQVLIIIGFIVGCYSGYTKLKYSSVRIPNKDLLSYITGQ